MQVSVNPRDPNSFASASLDKTIKVWGVGTTRSSAHYTLTGHKAGVNCVAYAPTGEKPLLVSGGDDYLVKVWDYQTKHCVFTFEAHNDNISAVAFHPDLPIIFSCGEDNLINIWNAITYKQEQQLNYGLERVW